jgi:3'(2'), 5'-bisphosphate nucleotidase
MGRCFRAIARFLDSFMDSFIDRCMDSPAGSALDKLEKIRWLISNCGQQARLLGEQGFQVFQKGVADYVTDVDRLLDEQLTTEFATLFPGDGIITEENARSRQAFLQDYQRLWVIDPLDGTDDFIHRRPHYAVMVGLLAAGQPQAGWIYAPELDQLYFGGPGWGLFQAQGNGEAIALPFADPPPLSPVYCPVMIGDKDQRRFGTALRQQIPGLQFRTIGSFGLKVMEVVCGRAGLYLYLNGRVKLWDTTGPLALARAAGLICCDLEGNPLRFTPDAVDLDTLTHHQAILIGWPAYVEALRSPIQAIVKVIGLPVESQELQ